MVLAFTVVLFLEKIIADDHHSHSEEEKHHRRTTLKSIQQSREMTTDIGKKKMEVIEEEKENNKPAESNDSHTNKMTSYSFNAGPKADFDQHSKKNLLTEKVEEEDEMEEAFKQVIRTASKMAHRVTIMRASQKVDALQRKNLNFILFLNFMQQKERSMNIKAIHGDLTYYRLLLEFML